MRKFSKILPRRLQGRAGDEDPNRPLSKNGPGLLDPTDFHQLSSPRRVNGHATALKKATRTGKSRILAPAAEVKPRRSGLDGATNGDAEKPATDAEGEEAHTVCDTCSSIDFPRLLSWKPGNSRPWVSLAHTLKDTSECPYCTFFQAMIGHVPRNEGRRLELTPPQEANNESSDESTGTFTPYLRIRQAFERLGMGPKHELAKSVLFEVTTKSKTLPRGYIIRAVPDEVSIQGYVPKSQANGGESEKNSTTASASSVQGRTVSPLVDAELLKCWVDFCKTYHKDEACAKPQTLKPVEGLRLIDCKQRKIVPAKDLEDVDLEYSTLSYVSGESDHVGNDETSAPDTLPDNLPTLFKDAIQLVSSLGYSYLWIDRYCVAPTIKTQAKKQYIDQIGKIFEKSALTIIATGSDSIHDGIHGVSVPREDQLSLQIGSEIFTTSLVRPDVETKSSRWSSRAWTFQEGLLSRRRLILTPSQAYFQCRKMHCHESLSMPLQLASTVNLGRIFPAHVNQSFEDLRLQIAMYMEKDITRPEERLDAFKGVLNAFSQGSRGLTSLLGLPLFHPDDFSNLKVVSQTDLLALGLGWIAAEKKAASSASIDTAADSSSSDYTSPYYLSDEFPFPSWTWLSWRPRTTAAAPTSRSFRFNLVGDESKPLEGACAPPGTEISVGFEDDMVVSWEIDGEAIARRVERIKFLRIQTYCFDIKVSVVQGGALSVSEPDGVFTDTTKGTIAEIVRLIRADDVSTLAITKEDYTLTGILVAGRNWRKTEPEAGSSPRANTSDDNGAATVLLCGHKGWDENAPLIRLGATNLEFTAFSVSENTLGGQGDSAALLSVAGGGDLPLIMREVDLY